MKVLLIILLLVPILGTSQERRKDLTETLLELRIPKYKNPLDSIYRKNWTIFHKHEIRGEKRLNPVLSEGMMLFSQKLDDGKAHTLASIVMYKFYPAEGFITKHEQRSMFDYIDAQQVYDSVLVLRKRLIDSEKKFKK